MGLLDNLGLGDLIKGALGQAESAALPALIVREKLDLVVANAENAANGSGLQWSTIRNIALAWVLTLPAAMILSGVLYLLFSRIL